MKKIIVLLLLVVLPMSVFAQSKKNTKKANANTVAWMYEVEPCGEAKAGGEMIKVWSYAPDVTSAKAQAAKNAVHAVIFKGIESDGRGHGIVKLDRTNNAETEHAEFFKGFFADGGKYMQFVTLVNNGVTGAGDIIKLDKRTFKVGVVVLVNYKSLRKYLEDQNVIKKLSAGF